jgi:hypothetical protein
MPDAKWFLFFGGALLWLAGCNIEMGGNQPGAKGEPVIAEGTLLYVKYDYGDGKVGGFTRVDNAQAVPGGNGSWNVDARGKLTSKFLVITYPSQKELGPHVIPAERLFEVQFVDADSYRINRNASLESATHDHGDR